MRGAVVMLLFSSVMAGCSGGSVASACDGQSAELVLAAVERPSKDPALYWVVELHTPEGKQIEERDGFDSGCHVFTPPAPGAYKIASAYALKDSDCGYLGETGFQWDGQRTVVVVDEHEHRCRQ